MSNFRTFYACQALAFSPESTHNYLPARGVQSVGVNTNFELDSLFELGMVQVYQQLEKEPNVEVTAEKLLDGHPLLWHQATQGAASASLVGRSTRKCNLLVSVFPDTQEAASGTPVAQCLLSGFFGSQLSYRFQVDGPFTEQLTLVGNSKEWDYTAPYLWSGTFTTTGVPLAAEGVNFRQHFNMGLSRFPTDVQGISASGTNDKTGDIFGAHLQTVTVSSSFGRDNLFELGRKGPYFRFVAFPVEVSCEISITATAGDNVNAQAEATNLTNQTIYLATQEGTKIDLGQKNKLMSVTMQGGNAGQGGGNVTVTYNYRTFNDMTVTHPRDPTTALAA